HLVRYGAAKDEAARLDPGNLVDLGSGPGMHQFIDRTTECTGIPEHGCDVTKQDSGLRVIRDGADGGKQRLFDCGFHRLGSGLVTSIMCPCWHKRKGRLEAAPNL